MFLLGGVGLSGINSQGSTIVSRADQEITEVDMDQAISAAEESIPASLMQNRKKYLLHSHRLENRRQTGFGQSPWYERGEAGIKGSFY